MNFANSSNGANRDLNTRITSMTPVGYFNPQSSQPIGNLPVVSMSPQGLPLTTPLQSFSGVSTGPLPLSSFERSLDMFLQSAAPTQQRTDPPAIEDVQEINAPLPLPSQLPVVNLPLRVTATPGVPTILQGNQSGLVVTQNNSLNQGGFNRAAPTNSSRSASFVLPPSVIIQR